MAHSRKGESAPPSSMEMREIAPGSSAGFGKPSQESNLPYAQFETSETNRVDSQPSKVEGIAFDVIYYTREVIEIMSLSLTEEFQWPSSVVALAKLFLEPINTIFGLNTVSRESVAQFYVFLGIVLLFIVNTIVVHFVTRDGHAKNIQVLKSFRFLATGVITAYVTLLWAFASPLSCYIHAVGCVRSGESTFRMILAIPISICFVMISILLVLLFYDDDLKQSRVIGKSHARVDFFYLIAKTLLVVMWVFAPSAKEFRLVMLIVLMLVIFVIQLVLSPYYHDRMNHAKAGSILCAAGTALAALISLSKGITDSSRVALLVVLVVVFGGIGVLASMLVARGRRKTTVLLAQSMEGLSEMEVKERLFFPSPYHVDVMVRSLIRYGQSATKRSRSYTLRGMMRGVTIRSSPVQEIESDQVHLPSFDKEAQTNESLLFMVLGAAVAQFPGSALVRLHVARALLAISEKKALQARTQLLLAQRFEKPPIDIRYRLFSLLNKIRTSQFGSAMIGGQMDMDVIGFAEFRRQHRRAAKRSRSARKAMARFWDLVKQQVSTRSKDIITKLPYAAARVDRSERRAREAYDELLAKHPRSRRLLRDYAKFLAEVARDLAASRACLQLADAIDARRTRKSRPTGKMRGFDNAGSEATGPSIFQDESNEATIAGLQRKVGQLISATNRTSMIRSPLIKALSRFLVFIVIMGGSIGYIVYAIGLFAIPQYRTLVSRAHDSSERVFQGSEAMWDARTVAWDAQWNFTLAWENTREELSEDGEEFAHLHAQLYEDDSNDWSINSHMWHEQLYVVSDIYGQTKQVSFLDYVWSIIRSISKIAEDTPALGGFSSQAASEWKFVALNGGDEFYRALQNGTAFYQDYSLYSLVLYKNILIIGGCSLVMMDLIVSMGTALPIWTKIRQERHNTLSLFFLVPPEAIETLRNMFRTSAKAKRAILDHVSVGSSQHDSRASSNKLSFEDSGLSSSHASSFEDEVLSDDSDEELQEDVSRRSTLSKLLKSYVFRAVVQVVIGCPGYFTVLVVLIHVNMPGLNELAGASERLELAGASSYLAREIAWSRGYSGSTIMWPSAPGSSTFMTEANAQALLETKLETLMALHYNLRAGNKEFNYPGVTPGTKQGLITYGDPNDASVVCVDSTLNALLLHCRKAMRVPYGDTAAADVAVLDLGTSFEDMMKPLVASADETYIVYTNEANSRHAAHQVYGVVIVTYLIGVFTYNWNIRLIRELEQSHKRTRRMVEMIPEEAVEDVPELQDYLQSKNSVMTPALLALVKSARESGKTGDDFEHPTTGMLFLNSNGTILGFGNPEILGKKMEELDGQSFAVLGKEDGLESLLNPNEVRSLVTHFKGVPFPIFVRVSPIVDIVDDESVAYCVLLSSDVDESEEDKDEMNIQKFPCAEQVPLLRVCDGEIVFASEEALRLMEVRKDQVTGRKMDAVLRVAFDVEEWKSLTVLENGVALEGYLNKTPHGDSFIALRKTVTLRRFDSQSDRGFGSTSGTPMETPVETPVRTPMGSPRAAVGKGFVSQSRTTVVPSAVRMLNTEEGLLVESDEEKEQSPASEKLDS